MQLRAAGQLDPPVTSYDERLQQGPWWSESQAQADGRKRLARLAGQLAQTRALALRISAHACRLRLSLVHGTLGAVHDQCAQTAEAIDGVLRSHSDPCRGEPNGLQPVLLDEIDRRARAGRCRFALLIPDAPNRKAADWTLEVAIPLLERAARGKVEGLVGGPDPFDAVQRAVDEGHFNEIIVSTLPKQRSKWRRRGLIRRVEGLGLPVTAVVPRQKSIIDTVDDLPMSL